MGLSQLKRVDRFVKERRKIYKRYIDELNDEKFIDVINERDGVESSYHLVIIKLRGQFAKKRDKLFKYRETMELEFNYTIEQFIDIH